MALFPLMAPGCNVVASTKLYGGTIQQFSNTIRKFGWSAKFVDFDDPKAIEAAIDGDTRAIFCERSQPRRLHHRPARHRRVANRPACR
jgi:O-acetylhomoserine (thiol)-lyase